jgi:signal transduction histidine kinase
MSKPVKVLIVEDSDDDARLVVRMLRLGGFSPSYRRVQDIESLRRAFQEETWDAVLSDFRMPSFNGVEALRVFRGLDLDIPFIFVSGTIGEEVAVEAMKAGASDYVMKQNLARLAPVLERELAQAVIRAEHRRAHVELELSRDHYEAQLRHAQKMESIGTLAGGIAHDFNNILGGILGNTALALEALGEAHPASTHLHEVHKASVRARTLVRQILTFSRREPQELIAQSLRPVVEETRRLLRATLPAGVELDVTLGDEAPHVHADATQIQQVLMNLCTNAWHALKDGVGRVAIGLDAVTLDAAAGQRLGGLPSGPYAHLWVSDTGTGMDAATRERIFEPFFTTKPVGQGTGLGLSVAHGIVVAHRGAIAVDSVPGKGSTLHLYLPAVESVAAAASAQDAAQLDTLGHGERVLYVDDDEIMVLMVERLLQRSGYRVSTFQSANAALAAVRDDPDTFDFVVTDFNMPECSGLDLAHELARIRPELPVVISSGYITDDLLDLAREAGVRGLIEKQNTFEDLCELLARVLSGAKPGR